MNAYSEDLRIKIVEARERDMPTVEVAKTFGVGVSSVKRYVATAREGRSLAPKRHPGSRPKIDENVRKLLELDLEERPAATLYERRAFLELTAGVRVSESTISRMLRRLGWSRKKIAGSTRARRVFESSLAAVVRREGRGRSLGVRGRDGR